MVGVIQEQHPGRCRLFMQWKQMDWPILIDPLNRLGIDVVPLTMAVDEYGIIRAKGLSTEDAQSIEETFVRREYEPPAGAAPAPAKPEPPNLHSLQIAAQEGGAAAWRRYGDALALWAGPERLTHAVTAFQKALELQPDHGPAHFRLGSAYRMRYDSEHRQPDDFQNAVRQWKTALDINPNQYIWRRRIQQYGPRLDKPYPFYDWVPKAREEIRARGEEPVELRVEPRGSEFAEPVKEFSILSGGEEPDPEGRIHRDDGLIHAETAAVPPEVGPGEPARIHVTFRPNEARKAHWNNEVEGLEFWVDPPEGWSVDRQRIQLPNPPKVVSKEPRQVEFEIRPPEGAQPGEAEVPAYALYYVCEDVTGTCLYRRQDVESALEVRR